MGKDLLPADAIPWANVERLKGLPVVKFKARIAEEPFGVVIKRIFEVLLVVVHGPLMDSHNSL
jgi:hypothetical protein